MTDLVQRITEAIFRQEGMPPDWPNPGNLRDCPWFPVLPIPGDPEGRHARCYTERGITIQVQYAGGFWKPASRAQGVAGALHVVALRIAEGQTLRTLITAWAPPSDGNATDAYIANVQDWAAITDADAVLYELL